MLGAVLGAFQDTILALFMWEKKQVGVWVWAHVIPSSLARVQWWTLDTVATSRTGN